MRLKLTLTLFLANILVLGLIFYLDQAKPSDLEQPLQGIVGPEIKTATAFHLSGRLSDTGPEIERHFVFEDQRWYIEQPFRWPANIDALSRMFSTLLFQTSEIRFPVSEIEAAGKTLAEYGLDPARLTLKFDFPEREPMEVLIGAPTEVGNRLYVLAPGGDEILVTSVDLLRALAIDLNIIRDRRVFDIPDFEVRELVMRITTTGDLTVRLKKDADRWRFETPIEVEADMELVRTTLRQLTRLEALQFPDTIEAEARVSSIENPLVRITLEGNDRRDTLLVGGEAPEVGGEPAYYAQLENRPVVITVPAAPFDQLLQAQRELRERDFLKLNQEALSGVTMTRGPQDASLVLKRLETLSWQVVDQAEDGAPVAVSADQAVVERLLKNLGRIEALGFVSDVPTSADLDNYGLSEPAWTLRFQNAGGSERVLLVGKETRLPDGTPALYVKLESQRFVYAMARDVTRLWILDPLFYRDRMLQRLSNASRIQQVVVERIGDQLETLVDEAIDPNTQTWGTYLASWPTERQGPFWDLIGQFRTLEVAAFLENKFSADGYSSLAETYPWTLKVSVTLALPNDQSGFKNEVQTFYFTDRVSGSFQAGGSPDLNAVFQVHPDMMENLFTLFFERELPPEFEPPQEPTAPASSDTAPSDSPAP